MAANFYKFVKLPVAWPGRQRAANYQPIKSPFKGRAWNTIEKKLDRELKHLRAKEITIGIDLDFGAIRPDGGIYADARPRSPKIIVSFVDGRYAVKRQFPCDTYAYWQDNVWAIALTLESLRAIDRYGVTQGDQQYVGFAALSSGGKPEPTPEEAATLIAKHADLEADAVLGFPSVARAAIRMARAKTHPDSNGGTDNGFAGIEEAARIIETHFGGSL